MQRYGVEGDSRYMVMDTICDATQERQSAVYDMVDGAEKPDMMIVVGGFNSSNTSHLQVGLSWLSDTAWRKTVSLCPLCCRAQSKADS